MNAEIIHAMLKQLARIRKVLLRAHVTQDMQEMVSCVQVSEHTKYQS
jgi:hypothetical protein